MTRAGRIYRYRAADRNLAVRHFPLRWWLAYLADLARHPRARRCQVNPYNRFRGDAARQRCWVLLTTQTRPLHYHGTREQWSRALIDRATALAYDEADLR